MYHSKLLPWFAHFNVLSGKPVIFLFSLNQNTLCCSFCAQISVFNTWKILFCVKSHFILTLKGNENCFGVRDKICYICSYC